MTAAMAPVVVDIGKQKPKTLKALKRGEGPIMEDIAKALAEVRANSPQLANKELVPVVVIYRKKPARKNRGLLPFGMLK